MKEEEANRKSCPFYKGFCRASDCMMWEQWPKWENNKIVRAEGKMVMSDNGDCGLKSKDLEVNI